MNHFSLQKTYRLYGAVSFITLLPTVLFAENIATNKAQELNQSTNLDPYNIEKQFKNSSAQAWFNHHSKKINQPLNNLDNKLLDKFYEGRSFASIPWVESPSATTARDGLGPLFNANTCISCHRKSGAGEVYNKKGELSRAVLTKLSRKSGLDIPFYGSQIAVNGVFGVPFEGKPTRKNHKTTLTYPDGQKIILTKPEYFIEQLNYGPLPKDIIIVQRRAPSLMGVGLIDRLSEQSILANEDINDENHDGISGKANWITMPDGSKQIGKFAHKANAQSLTYQIAVAAHNDMGLSNPIYPMENCTAEQTACNQATKGKAAYNGELLDLPESRMEAIRIFFSFSQVPVAKKTPQFFAAQALFKETGCHACHKTQMQTQDGIKFDPYSDFLLHDMGEGLADGRIENLANGNEFRTAPLWGAGLQKYTLKSKTPHYLHDGRAKTIEEAILWHGGEAASAKAKFMSLTKEQRQVLLDFINQL